MIKQLGNRILSLQVLISISLVKNAKPKPRKKAETKSKQRLKKKNTAKSSKSSTKKLKQISPKTTGPQKAANVKKVHRFRKVKPKRKLPENKSTKDEDIPTEVMWLREDPRESLLSRFVETPKGNNVGESIGIERSRIILKKKLNFYSIPLKYVKEKDDKLVLTHKVNWTRAAKLGEIWRRKALDIIPKKKKTKGKKPKKVERQ